MSFKISPNNPLNHNFDAKTSANSNQLSLQSNTVSENRQTFERLSRSLPAKTDAPTTPEGFLSKVLTEQPIDKNLKTANKSIIINPDKSPDKMTAADYKKAFYRALLTDAKQANVSEKDLSLIMNLNEKEWTNFDIETLRREDARPGAMTVTVNRYSIELADRTAQAVSQYRQYQAGQLDKAITRGNNYATDAVGGFVQPLVNAPVNVVNGATEPLRAVERLTIGTQYIPEIPRMSAAERSEYWQKDGRSYANTGAEIGATILLGGATGAKAAGTQAGRIFLGTESVYNIGAGVAGKDITQTDKNGNAREMPFWERGLRVTGGILGARQTIHTEIAAPNSTVNKLNDIFGRRQAEMVTPEGFRVRTNQPTKPVQTPQDAITEMRGSGGYESNEIYDRLGTKMPRVRQPLEVKPSMKPNAVNKPFGEIERIRPKAAPENIRGLTRQNEAAETLAKNGYFVEQKPQLTNTDRMSNPWLKAEKKPDFKIEGEIFDAYSPSKNKSSVNIRSEIELKINEGQTRRIILNLDDSKINPKDLKEVILEKPVLELEQILIVKDGKVTNFFPFEN